MKEVAKLIRWRLSKPQEQREQGERKTGWSGDAITGSQAPDPNQVSEN